MNEWVELGARVIALAERLVRTPSVVDSAGEAEVGRLLAEYLYEQAQGLPGVVVKAVPAGKPNEAISALAYAPARVKTVKTLILMGHFDTVGVEPYAALRESACDSDVLKQAYLGHPDPAVAAAAEDPDWRFGRGWLDMKGGIAAITEVFLAEARRGELPANLVLLLTADEESASRGLRTLLPELVELKREHNLEFLRVVNADYISPLYDGDERRYLYSGTVGKQLLGLSVFGATAHVGQTFEGLNANALAGYLAFAYEHDRKLLAGVGGEWLPPPTVLHLGDDRERYDVQTVEYAALYVNLFHTGTEAKALWRGIVEETRRLVKRYDRELRLRYNRFVARADLKLPRYPHPAEVIDYATLVKRVAEHTGDAAPHIARLMAEAAEQHEDERECGLYVIRGLHTLLPPARPVVVASLLPPFYPAQIAPRHSDNTNQLKDYCAANGLSHRWVYPYIADMSYFAFGDSAGLNNWAKQSPLWFDDAELRLYHDACAPVCNLGPWGMGAHSAEERVYLPFLRDELPRLLSGLLHELAG